jgi:hypothetical protein
MERFLVLSASIATRGFLSVVLVGTAVNDGADPAGGEVSGLSILVSVLTVLFTYFLTTLAVLDDKCCPCCQCFLKSMMASGLRMFICLLGCSCWFLFLILLLLPEFVSYATSVMTAFGISLIHSYTWQFVLLEVVLYLMAVCSSADKKIKQKGGEVPSIEVLNKLARGEKVEDYAIGTPTSATTTATGGTATGGAGATGAATTPSGAPSTTTTVSGTTTTTTTTPLAVPAAATGAGGVVDASAGEHAAATPGTDSATV